MTNLADKREIPEFEGLTVDRTAIKLTGAGTGMHEGLKVQPMVMEVGDEDFFIFKGRCAGVEHAEDKNEDLVRIHKIHPVQMAPIDAEIARKAIAEYEQRIEDAKGQLQLRYEQEAEERERADLASTGSARATNTSE